MTLIVSDKAYRLYQNGTTQTLSGLYPTEETNFDRPLTAKRKKPTDLFGNQTSRIVKYSRTRYTYGNLQENATTMTIAPYSYWARQSTNVIAADNLSYGDFSDLDLKLRIKIKDELVNLGQFIGEYKQTANTFQTVVRQTANSFRATFSGSARKRIIAAIRDPKFKLDKQLANQWLQWTYGIRPFLMDVHGSAEALARGIREGKDYFFRAKVVVNKRGVNPYVLGPTSFDAVLTKKGVARVHVGDPNLKTLSELGLTNPMALTWELLPYSFVFDWFINVGDWLKGLDALLGISRIDVNRSWSLRTTNSGALTYNVSPTYGFKLPPTFTYLYVVNGRLATTQGLAFGYPKWQPSLSWRRIVSAIALVRQVYK